MSDLSKRAAKYYLVQGVRLFIAVLLGMTFVGTVWILTHFGETNYVESVFYRIFSLGTVFMIMMNFMYSVYSPGWYDSMVLSMGARRKDIFWGVLIKQITFIVCYAIFLSLMSILTSRPERIKSIMMSSAVSLFMGAAGIIVGHAVKKYGRIVYHIFLIIVLGVGSGSLVMLEHREHVFTLGNATKYVIAMAGLLLFVIMEFVIYRLNKKSMVA